MKVILTGATGYVGEGVLLAMLDDVRIEQVLVVGRRSCGVRHHKLEEYIVEDFMSLQAGDSMLEGYDVVFFIAGITSVGTPKDVYERVCYSIPVHFADIMPHKQHTTFIYLSGAGTSVKGRLHWQQVKSRTETAVMHMGFKQAYGWRPMMMAPYTGQKNHQVKAQKAVLLLWPLLRALKVYCTMPEMVNAMYHAATAGLPSPYVEARDIIIYGQPAS